MEVQSQFMDDKDLNQVMSVLSTKVPYPVKMFFVEKAMIYKMTLNSYMNILLRQLMRNDDLLNPEKVKAMVDSIAEVETMRDLNAQLRSEIQKLESVNAALELGVTQKNETISGLKSQVSDLRKRLESSESSKASVEAHMTNKQRKASQMSNKRLSEVNEKLSDALQKIKNLEARIAKANNRFKDEDIRDGGGLFQEGKLFQV